MELSNESKPYHRLYLESIDEVSHDWLQRFLSEKRYRMVGLFQVGQPEAG